MLIFKVLIIGFIWPEPQSSAAGLRTLNLIEMFLENAWDLIFASPACENFASENLKKKGIQIFSIPANNPRFDDFIKEQQPDYVIFDRFLIEEQFGWRVQDACPEAFRILDTVDLHFLRRDRQRLIKDKKSPYNSEDTLRELASIYRSDLSLIISSFEMQLLIDTYKISSEFLLLSRLHYPMPPPAFPDFIEREHFMMIGNFRHAPNSDAVIWLKEEIWPLIRQKIDNAQVFIYGAYPPKHLMDLTEPKCGFHVMGSAPDQFAVLRKHRVNLAPLRFGAGIKGKISDGWWSGTPVVTTSVGAEGMSDSSLWGGLIAKDAVEFADHAVELYQNQDRWKSFQKEGLEILKISYDQKAHSDSLIQNLILLKARLKSHRESNYVGAILNHHLYRSTKYFSKWIEAKNQITQISKMP